MNDSLASLDALGLRFGTDKSSAGHNYLNFYERYLVDIRHRPVKLLEIGILGGASLAMWEAYFQNGCIVGADIDKSTMRFGRERITIEIVDQSNIEHLTQLGIRHGPFDVIIEDGSHMWEHQITSLKTLFPFVKNGGYYVVEDLQTNFGAMSADYQGVASISCADYLKRLVDARIADDQIDQTKEEDAFLRTYGRSMSSINFSRHVCLIEKMYENEIIQGSNEPFVLSAPGAAVVSVHLMAHIGGQGDKTSTSGCIRVARKGKGIQGFSLQAGGKMQPPLRYRARSSSGVWSEWARAGAFVGTRGRAENLSGFSIRLDDRSDGAFTLRAIAQFSGSADLIDLQGGGDCASPSGRHALIGMQIILQSK